VAHQYIWIQNHFVGANDHTRERCVQLKSEMYKLLALFVILYLSALTSYSQNFEFIWKLRQYIDISYEVKISEKNSTRNIVIKWIPFHDSIINQVEKQDCDLLVSFLKKYNFPNKGNIIYGPKKRIYNDTQVLPDTNWVLMKDDSVRRELLWIHGYLFDNVTNKFYEETQSLGFWTDGHTYSGEYRFDNGQKEFSVYCAQVTTEDYILNKLIYSLIKKYASKMNFVMDFGHLGTLIESDKPKPQR
jgi:hypothetical protein